MVDERGSCPRPSKACGLTTCELPVLRIRLRRRWISENSKANRIQTMKGPAESGEICSVEVESKKNSEENS